MTGMAIHSTSALHAIGAALNQILAESPEEISADLLVNRVVADNPTWKTGDRQLNRQARDLLRACFDFGSLRDEATAIKSKNPAAITHYEIDRLREIGELFEAAAQALEAAEKGARL